MSTKTIYKRIALVAVASLGAGLLSVAPASAADGVVTGSVGPVRVTFTGANRDAVPATTFSFTNTSQALVDATTAAELVVTSAPDVSAVVSVTVDGGTLTDRLLDGGSTVAAGGFTGSVGASATMTGTLSLTTAAAAGSYAGHLTYTDSAGHTLKVNWSFTTTGAPKTIALAMTPTSVPSAATAVASSVTLTVRDAANNLTQLATGDTVTLTSSNATEIPTFGDVTTAASEIPAGTRDISVTPKNSAIAGTYTITATPAGTLPAAGVVAATTSLTVAAIATQGAASLSVSSPTTDILASTTTATAAVTKLNPAIVNGSIVVTGSGVTPNAPVAVAVGANIASATDALKVNGVSVDEDAQAGAGVTDATVYVVANAAGVISFSVDVSGATVANADVIKLTLGSPIAAAGNTYAVLSLTYETAALAFTTTPAHSGLAVAKIGDPVSVAIKAVDQYGNGYANYVVSANLAGTATGATTATTGTSVSARTALNGTATLSVPAPSATFAGNATLTTKLTTPSGGSSGASDSTVTVTYSTTGLAGTLVLADSDTTTTDDNKSTRTVVIAPAALTANEAANTDNLVAITVTTTAPASLTYSAVATNGIRLFTADLTALTAGASTVTGTAGTTTIYAVPTKIGDGTITVTAGGLSKVFTLTGILNTAPKGQLITVTAQATAGAFTVKVTDIFGNPVAATVDLSLAGAGTTSSGFKNISLTTLATTGENTFDVTSSGSSATTITGVIASGSFQAVLATEATTQGFSGASVQTATASLAGAGGAVSGSLATLTTLINSLVAKINALSKLVAKIQKKVRA